MCYSPPPPSFYRVIRMVQKDMLKGHNWKQLKGYGG